MLQATIVANEDELTQIQNLNLLNLKQNLTPAEMEKEGFVTWLYSMELLREMHSLAPSVIVKENNTVVGYALVTLKEAAVFHPDLRMMIADLEPLMYNSRTLFSYAFYIMGQVCIDKKYRGSGVFNMLYAEHRKVYNKRYELVVTEIDVSNIRSQKAHEKTGFKLINNDSDKLRQWNIVAWDWT